MHFLDFSQSIGEISGHVVHSHEENALSHLFEAVPLAHEFVDWAKERNLTLAIINNIFVKASARGLGTAERLLNDFSCRAAEKGADVLMVTSTRHEFDAPIKVLSQWYISCGFEPFDKTQTELVMIKKIKPEMPTLKTNLA